uniref:hypothetical protein n=1 Tax=Roseovarius indicus TaxID=540747 RepID=UPI003B52316A
MANEKRWDEKAEKRAEELESFAVDFHDRFAPSHTEFLAPPDFETDAAGVRLLFYNRHLTTERLPWVLKLCEALGCPEVMPNCGVLTPEIDSNFAGSAIGKAGRLANELPETSFVWSALKAYIHYINVFWLLTEKKEQMALILEEMFLVGAACREIELSLLNRRDALRGKGTLASTKKGGQTRSSDHAPKRAEILRRMGERIERNESAAHAARQVARELGMKSEAVRSTYYRYKSDV